jgi:uncharacterized protein (TIGR00297 family)
VALLAFGFRALTGLGALAATAIGSAILIGTGLPGGAVLLTFFIGGSIVSRVSPDPASRLGAKGSARDQWQVLANGGAAAAGSLAVAAADTWATSIGAWSRRAPRHLLSGKVVPPGTSGGITLLGTVGALAGAVMVAGVGGLVSHQGRLLAFATMVGFVGMLADSALGAGLQGRFYCAQCREDTERRVHHCGTRSVPRGGLPWLNNDGVNALATTLGGMAGWAGWWWLGSR